MENNVPSRVQLVFDTNILLDALLARGPYFQYGVELLEHVRDGLVEGWVAPHCLTTVYYILERHLARETRNRKESNRLARALLNEIMGFLKPLPETGTEIMSLDADTGDDLEDQLIVELSQRYLENPLIITRDKWFLKTNMSAAHPKEVIDQNLHRDVPDPHDIPFIDLAAQQRLLQPALSDKIQTVLRHGKYIMGPEVAELQRRLAEYVGVNHCISCSSGTDALLMALMAKDIGPGDAVLTTPFTFFATAEVIALLGATPIFVDIDPQTFNMDPDALERVAGALKGNHSEAGPLPRVGGADRLVPKGIVAVDLFGQPCDYDRINAIAEKNNLFVIEDAAQSMGAQYKGRRANALAEIGCTSFFPAKPLGGYGDGGAVFTDDDRLAEALISIRVHGQGTDKYENRRIGLNGRLDTLQAAVLLTKLEIFPEEIHLRQAAADHYARLLSDHSASLTPPFVPDDMKSVWAQYSVLTKDAQCRERVQKGLKASGIPTAIYYPKPLHLQTAFSFLGYRAGDFPVSEDVGSRIFSLPMHPYLTESVQQRIVDVMGREIH